MFASALAGTIPAIATDDPCTTAVPDAYEISAGICELSFSAPGNYTVAPPAGVTKLTALIVGGGGGARVVDGSAYAGGGGHVVYVSAVDLSAAIEITVGAGVDGASDVGGASAVNGAMAAGGFSGGFVAVGDGSNWVGGTSGSGNAGSAYGGSPPTGGAGGGAAGPADDITGGPGLTPSQAANDNTLWPALFGEPEYGHGGSNFAQVPQMQRAGLGASADDSFGLDGIVVLRWAAPAVTPTHELPATGVNLGPAGLMGVALAVIGTSFKVFGVRERR